MKNIKNVFITTAREMRLTAGFVPVSYPTLVCYQLVAAVQTALCDEAIKTYPCCYTL